MLNSEEIVLFCEGVADQVEAGITLSDAIERLASSITSHEEILNEIYTDMKNGERFGDILPRYDLLPKEMWSQIDLGEHTGCLGEVMTNLGHHHASYNKNIKQAKSALLKPGLIVLSAIGAFVGFLVFIFPIFAKNLPAEQRESGLFYLSSIFQGAYENMPYVFLSPLIVGIYVIHLAKTNQEFQDLIYTLLLKIPYYGEGVRKMILAGWCTNTAIGIKAGMSVFDAINLSNQGLLEDMIPSFELLMKDVESHGWTYSIKKSNWAEDDPRWQWPLHLVIAIDVGGELNKLDTTLSRAAAKMMEYSQRDITRGVAFATTVATVISVSFILALSMSLIFAQASMYKAMSGGM